jgi:transcriptional regulator with XRE-family HTH domain
MQYFERIVFERERLGLTQADAGEACGVTRAMWGRYEKGKASMGADVLARFVQAGADANYIFTGVRAAPICDAEEDELGPLAPEEAALIKNYRLCPADARKALTTTSNLLAQPKGGKLKDVG